MLLADTSQPFRNDATCPAVTADQVRAWLSAPMFGCHKSPEGREYACAGWLAVAGADHLGVRLAVAMRTLPGEALSPGADWPELYGSYEEMRAANSGRQKGTEL